MIGSHRRQEIDDPATDHMIGQAKAVPEWLFDPRSSRPTVEFDHILDTRDWPAFSGSTMPSIPAALSLTALMRDHDCWEQGGKSWLAILYPRGLVFKYQGKS